MPHAMRARMMKRMMMMMAMASFSWTMVVAFLGVWGCVCEFSFVVYMEARMLWCGFAGADR
jgi:hypothetical protein